MNRRLALLASTVASVAPRPTPPLTELARIRGAMWPKLRLADLPWGPRPGSPDNIAMIDYIESYAVEQQAEMMAAYTDRRFTHAPMGPMVDAGYHGQIPAEDLRSDPSPYFDAAERWQDRGVEPIHFLRPDAGCAGLEWTIDDLDRELGPIFTSVRAQDTMRIVCLGWEPGGRYYYDSDWWRDMCAWMTRTFPHALRLIHMIADQDAPVGASDNGKPNGLAWQKVAPFLHGYLAQYGGYVDGGQSVDTFIPNLQDAIRDMTHRFATGGPDRTWPTWSAWGPQQPLKVYAGEYWAFRGYWQNAPFSDAVAIGNAAMAAGAAGYLDGGSVPV
jgi:hypothetical protein